MASHFQLGFTADQVQTKLREAFVKDEDIAELINNYLKSIQNDLVPTLVDKKHATWYTGPNLSPESHWSKLVTVLKTEKGWTDEMIESLSLSSCGVVKNLANPNHTTSHNHVKGLVLGYVQSGKTANYSAVITKALDAGYKFIIVLAGIHNNLRYQTEVRLRKEIVAPSQLKADPITRMDKNGDFDGKIAGLPDRVFGSSDGFGIAVLKKNATVLRKFNLWISQSSDEVKNACKVLIIDDESDQASINTSKDPANKPTAINKQLREIISKFRAVSYVGYTATPFANILINAQIDEDLFPKDFIVSLPKPASYIGAEELFGSIDLNGNVSDGIPLLKSITDIDHTEGNDDYDEDINTLPNSLKLAIEMFILAGALRLSRGQLDHISMLVHCSHLNEDQRGLKESIEEFVLLQKREMLRNPEKTLENYKNLKTSEFSTVSRKMKVEEDQLKDFELASNLKYFLESFVVILDNSKSDERLSFEQTFHGIVVGGNTLSRGLTIEGLTISYFLRSSKMYDSLMQMGRWFGYRPGYLDLTRIFITDELRDRFQEMASVENQLREEIEIMSENEDRPIDLRLRIRQHPGMTVTAKNKMYTATLENKSFSGRRGLPDFMNLIDEQISLKNKKAVEEIISAIDDLKIKKTSLLFSMFRKSLLYRECPKEIVLQFLESYHISKANSLANKDDLIHYITSNGNLTNWSIAIFSLIEGNDSYLFKNNEKVILLDRSYAEGVRKPEDPNASYIRGLYLPKDEMIDLADLYNSDDLSKVLKNEDGKTIGCAKIRSNKRPKDRALLAIYPLSENSKSEERQSGPYYLKPIQAKHVQFGIMIVFPDNKEFGHGGFVVNSTV